MALSLYSLYIHRLKDLITSESRRTLHSYTMASTTKTDENNPSVTEVDHESDEAAAMERVFSNTEVPSWRNQITFRAIITSFILSIVFNFIVCKLNLTTGIIPSLNVAAGLLGFFILKTWTTLLNKFGLLKHPFTRQENTVIQTCVVASSGIAFSSTFLNFFLIILIAISLYIYSFIDSNFHGNKQVELQVIC